MALEELFDTPERAYANSYTEYTSGIEGMGVEIWINQLEASIINKAAKADNEHWDAKCAKSGIGVLGVWYTTHDEDTEIDTVVQYEFQWRFGSGDGERRWAKSVITHHSRGSNGLTGLAACMVTYHAVQQQRMRLESKE